MFTSGTSDLARTDTLAFRNGGSGWSSLAFSSLKDGLLPRFSDTWSTMSSWLSWHAWWSFFGVIEWSLSFDKASIHVGKTEASRVILSSETRGSFTSGGRRSTKCCADLIGLDLFLTSCRAIKPNVKHEDPHFQLLDIYNLTSLIQSIKIELFRLAVKSDKAG